ncbi:MAG: hypothetical protein WAO98_10400, partial [Alphaproteobacteria bacterium]
VKHDLNGVLDDVKSDLQDASRQAGVYVRELADAASQTMSDATETVTECVTEKPIQSLAIAAGVGFFLGMLFRR